MKPLSCCEINKHNAANYTYCPDCGRYLLKYDTTPIPVTITNENYFREETVEDHPSYGQLEITRHTSNVNIHLYGSSIGCQNTITMKIKKSRRCYDNFVERYSAETDGYIEIEMSPSQFSEAITNMNCGSGIPVTIRNLMGRHIPYSEEIQMRERAERQLKGRFKQVSNRIKEEHAKLMQLLKQKGPLKATERSELLSAFEMFLQEIGENLPYLNECINETVDKSIMQAKVEIESYYTTKIQQLGLLKLDELIEESKQIENK